MPRPPTVGARLVQRMRVVDIRELVLINRERNSVECIEAEKRADDEQDGDEESCRREAVSPQRLPRALRLELLSLSSS